MGNPLTVDARDLLGLLQGTSVAMRKGKKGDSLPKLECVYLSHVDDYLVAFATDRYRLIEGSIKTKSELDGDLSPATEAMMSFSITGEDVAQLVKVLKEYTPKSGGAVTAELDVFPDGTGRGINLLEVRIYNSYSSRESGAILRYTGTMFEPVPYKHIIDDMEARITAMTLKVDLGEYAERLDLNFDIQLMAGFAKVPTDNTVTRLISSGYGKPMKVIIGHDRIQWIALLMPMRFTD